MAEGLVSGCDLPLSGRSGVVGVLAALKRSERAFEGNDVVFLEQVAHQIAIAVENALEYEKAIKDREKRRDRDSISRRKSVLSLGKSWERVPL